MAVISCIFIACSLGGWWVVKTRESWPYYVTVARGEAILLPGLGNAKRRKMWGWNLYPSTVMFIGSSFCSLITNPVSK